MKKLLFFICSLGAIVSCNRAELVRIEEKEAVNEVNEAVEGSVPVSFIINGSSLKTKGVSSLPNESELVNVTLQMTGYALNDSQLFSESFELGDKTDFTVNVRECKRIDFSVFSGPRDENGYLTTLDGQSEYLYAEGKLALQWEEIVNQTAPFELTLARRVNKITIEKISVNWTDDIYNSKEFRIKRIFLADVPRDLCKDTSIPVYTSRYATRYPDRQKELRYFNIAGLEEYSYYEQVVENYFYPEPDRLDAQLVDEVDVVVSKDAPYTVPHVFYAYINKSTLLEPQMRNASTRNEDYIYIGPAMTTIAVEAEMDGQTMFYRFQVHAPVDDGYLENTHIRFKELMITELGAPTFSGAKTYRNIGYEFKDWVEEEVEGPQESL